MFHNINMQQTQDRCRHVSLTANILDIVSRRALLGQRIPVGQTGFSKAPSHSHTNQFSYSFNYINLVIDIMHGHSIARDIAQRLGYRLHVTTLWPWELPSPWSLGFFRVHESCVSRSFILKQP